MLTTHPLYEEVAVWRQTQQGTVEDLAELDRILSRYRHPDTAVAHILARIADEDVPLNVAADIDQIVVEQDDLAAKVVYLLAPDTADDWVPDPSREYATEDEARAVIRDWMNAHVVRRVIVDTPIHTA